MSLWLLSHIRGVAHVPDRTGANPRRFKLAPSPLLPKHLHRWCSLMIKQETGVGMDSPYVRAMPLSRLKDLDSIERVLSAGNVLIIKITPIAKRSVEETKIAINQLSDFAKRQGGDIARLGEERVVLTPPGIRIWREKARHANTSLATEGHGG